MWRADSLEKTLMLGKIEGIKRSGQQRMRWLDSITNSMDMNLSKLREIVDDRGAWQATAHGVAKCQTWLRDWTTRNCFSFKYHNLIYTPENDSSNVFITHINNQNILKWEYNWEIFSSYTLLSMRNPRLWKFKWHTQGHRANLWWSNVRV